MMSAKVDNGAGRLAIMAVARCLFRTKGYEQTTLGDICERLAIAETDFYEYFGSKDDLLEAVWSAPRPAVDTDGWLPLGEAKK